MRVSKLENGQASETKWCRFLVRLPLLSHSRHRWTLEQWARVNQASVVRDRKELANVTIRLSKHVPGAEARITLLQTVVSLTKRAENVERLAIWQVCVDLLDFLSPRARAVRRARELAKVRMLPRLVGTVARVDTCRRSVPRRRSTRWENPPLQVRAGSQDTIMVGSVGSYFDVGSVSEVTLEPTGADEKICSMGAPNVREGESVDIETDSGAELSCFPVNFGADM